MEYAYPQKLEHKMLKIKILVQVALILVGMTSSFAANGAAKKLERADEIILVSNIRNILLKTQENVSLCLKDGGNNKSCFCKFKRNYEYLNDLTMDMFKQHPTWHLEQELVYEEDGKTKSLVPTVLKQQIEIKINCASYTVF